MKVSRFKFLAACVLGALTLVGCGGGGSSDPAAVVDPPPANGSYAGTYACTSSDGALVLTAVLPTPTGAFSSCGGTGAGGAVNITCTGSILAGGALAISGQDTHGNTLTLTGTATSTLASGNYSVAPAGVIGQFGCKH
jgi:hypothetical protein